MGVCINYRVGQRGERIKATLDRAQQLAETLGAQASITGISIMVRRPEPAQLFVDVAGCETIAFDFRSLREWKDKRGNSGWSYEWNTLTDDGKREHSMREDLRYSSYFTKTQYGDKLDCHRFVAEIVRMVASYCEWAEIYDEGDYYHTGQIDDAAEAIASTARVIAGVVDQLKAAGWEDKNIKTQE